MNTNLKRRIIFIMLMAALLGSGFYVGLRFEQFRSGQILENQESIFTEIINLEKDKPTAIDFGLFWKVLNALEERFVDQKKVEDKGNLVYGAIEGMVNSLGDPYTVFMRPKETKQFEEQIKGSFSGIGIEIGIRKELLTIIAPLKDTPAARAGLQAGDVITSINDEDAIGLSVDVAVSKIRGKRGTTVKLGILREDWSKPKEFFLVRDTIRIPVIDWTLVNNSQNQSTIAHLQIFTFNRNTEDEFEKAAQKIIGSRAQKIILDLRNNPGGLLDSAVNIASWFMAPDKEVVRERFANQTETVLRTKNVGKLKNYPLVVLINKGSASASEILAGALRDQRGVKIIGETSFGKGSVQELIDMNSDRDRSTLKITIAKWYTPNGISINDGGIKPDLEVIRTERDIENDFDPQLNKAIEWLSTER